MIFEVVVVTGVCIVIDIRLVHHIVFYIGLAAILQLCLTIEELARGEWPGQQITLAIKRSEEAIFLSPDHIFILLAHAHAIDQVEMWEWNDGYIVKVLDERKPFTELADVN